MCDNKRFTQKLSFGFSAFPQHKFAQQIKWFGSFATDFLYKLCLCVLCVMEAESRLLVSLHKILHRHMIILSIFCYKQFIEQWTYTKALLIWIQRRSFCTWFISIWNDIHCKISFSLSIDRFSVILIMNKIVISDSFVDIVDNNRQCNL